MSTGIDIFHGRRNEIPCKYWRKKSLDPTQLTSDTEPWGIFYAREENSQTDGIQDSGGFHLDTSSVTISTHDEVDIERDDVVEFDGEMWLVRGVQRKVERGRSQFVRHVVTYMELGQ